MVGRPEFESGVSATLVRLLSDYGMVLVLLVLGFFFSLATLKQQNPLGAAAGRSLASSLVRRYSSDVNVVVLAADTDEALQFSRAIVARLESQGAHIVALVNGGPSEMRRALQRISNGEIRTDVIACSEMVSRFGFLRDRAVRFPALRNTSVVIPARYYWPDFLKTANLRAVANRVAVIAIIAIGMTMVIITAGIDLSVGSLIAFSAVVATWLIRASQQQTAMIMTISCLTAVASCGAIGAFTGSMVTFFRIPPFIVTLAMMLVARGLAKRISNNESIYQIPESFTWLGRGFLLGVPNAVVFMLILYAVAHVVMTRTVFGRYIYAVGGNREAAWLSGVPVRRVVLACYVICAALAGVGGVIVASELRSGAGTYGTMAELEVIAAVVVGGTSLFGGQGKIFGTLVGALIIAVMRNGMNLVDVESNLQNIVLGFVILGAVLFDQVKNRFWALLTTRAIARHSSA